MPLSVLILSLIAIPLAKVKPRQGRLARFLPAVILYILYYNLMLLSKRWIIAGTVSPFVGIYWVHGMFFMIAMALLYKQKNETA